MYNYDDRITFHTLMLEMSEVTEQKAASPLLESATRFYPCDATLAPYQLLLGVCMSVCLSVFTSRRFIKMAKRVALPSTLCFNLQGNSGTSKNKGTSL